METDVSEEYITFILAAEYLPNKKPACSRWLGPEDGSNTFLRNVCSCTGYMAALMRL
jgi:hypothetical protein